MSDLAKLKAQDTHETAVVGCARCGKDHVGVLFMKLDRPMKGSTHWAPCPTNGQPILLRFEESQVQLP